MKLSEIETYEVDEGLQTRAEALYVIVYRGSSCKRGKVCRDYLQGVFEYESVDVEEFGDREFDFAGEDLPKIYLTYSNSWKENPEIFLEYLGDVEKLFEVTGGTELDKRKIEMRDVLGEGGIG